MSTFKALKVYQTMLNNLQEQKDFFNSGATLTFAFRKAQLLKLKNELLKNENAIYEALYTDLKKSKEEVWVTELSMVINEIKNTIRHLENWMAPEPVKTNFTNFPSKSYIQKSPLGIVLIIAPWNYPLQLLLNPLIGAIAAGNVVVLKGSEHAPAIDALMCNMINNIYNQNYISYYQGNGAIVVPALTNAIRFDHIFYTGSTAVGKLIYKMAAKTLTPVTLELGGKSPCVVTANANITKAAKRIVVAKFTNCGQMCVAPDYILVHQSKKQELIIALKNTIEKFFTKEPSTCYNYGKIINAQHWDRITNYLEAGTVVYGGAKNKETLYIQPTIVTDVSLQDKIMQEEIFGPVLPILTYTTEAEAQTIIAQNRNPLAFYIFTSKNREAKNWLRSIQFGGACVNNTAWHLTNHHLPFGGIGASGIGAYHGKKSFDTFSHEKSVMKTPMWFDPSVKYPPFKGKLKLFKWLMR